MSRNEGSEFIKLSIGRQDAKLLVNPLATQPVPVM